MHAGRPVQTAQIEWQGDTAYSLQFQDPYFSRAGGIEETRYVFLQQNHLPQRWQNPAHFRIGELGFGTGLNFLVTALAWHEQPRNAGWLEYFSFERFPLRIADLTEALSRWPEFSAWHQQLLAQYPLPMEGHFLIEWPDDQIRLHLLFGDANEWIETLIDPIDCWFFDGFAPSKNAELWNEALFRKIASTCHKQSSFSTYSAASAPRKQLQAAGFAVEKTKGFGKKREMLRGTYQGTVQSLETPPWYRYSKPELTFNAEKTISVIGAGIAGLTVAHRFAAQGWKVFLIDQHLQIAQGASGNMAAVLYPSLSATPSVESQFHLLAFLAAITKLQQWKAADAAFPWHPTGVLEFPKMRTASIDAWQQIALCYANEYASELVQAVDATQMTALSGLQITQAGLHYPQAGWLEPAALCNFLLQDQSAKIEWLPGVQIRELREEQNEWQCLDADNNVVTRSRLVVLATAQKPIVISHSQHLPIQPVRGQVCYLPTNEETRKLLRPVCAGSYLLPCHHQMHTLGATFEPGETEAIWNAEANIRLINELQKYVPTLQKHWNETYLQNEPTGRVSIRAASLDHLPIVGLLPDDAFSRQHYADLQQGRAHRHYASAQYQNGLLATLAHGSNGFTTSFLCADILFALATGLSPPVPRKMLSALHPGRFLIRDLQRGLVSN